MTPTAPPALAVAAPTMAAPAPIPGLIKDSDLATFMADVIEASRQVPVLVDFWAPWCGPCKQLTPLIEKAVREAAGAVRLVKVNIDENPEIAQQLRIQSIPAVFAFKNGKPVDGFVGALPESQIKEFIRRVGGAPAASPTVQALEQAKAALDSGDAGTASALFGQVLALEPGNATATTGLARCYLAAQDTARAQALVDQLPAAAQSTAEVAAVRAALEVAAQGAAAGDTEVLARQVAANPADHQARFDLAASLFVAGQRAEAIDHLLELFRRERKWNEEAARKQMVKFFEVLGPTHELTVSGRKRLSTLMFA